MEMQPPLPSEIWDVTPPEAQAYIEALVARVAALEATVKDLTEGLQQDSHNSSRPPSSDTYRIFKRYFAALPRVAAGVAGGGNRS